MDSLRTVIGKDLGRAATLLRGGEIVAIPTETVYGLAANALDESAVRKIFAAKNRPFFNPLIMHMASADWMDRYAREVPAVAWALAEAFWPGPLTLVLPKRPGVSDLVTAGLDTVALRVPGHLLCLELLTMLDFPLAAPSANPFGYISPTTAVHVERQLGGLVPYILDGGPCEVGVESTIVAAETGGVRILRPGGVPAEDIEKIAGPLLQTLPSEGDSPRAPGMLKAHYAPRKRLYFGQIDALLAEGRWPAHRVGVLSFSKKHPGIPDSQQLVLSLEGDLDAAARRLFEALHSLDAMDIELILAEEFPNRDIGLAINDRLRRAAHGSAGH